jgi:hypothetical protein
MPAAMAPASRSGVAASYSSQLRRAVAIEPVAQVAALLEVARRG